MLHVEVERIPHGPPAECRWPRGRDPVAAGVQEGHPRPAHEPLERPADEEVDAAGVHVEVERADRLVRVDDQSRALAVTDLREPADVLDRSARVIDVARAHERRALVNGALEELEWDVDAVRAADELDLDAAGRERQPGVAVGREVDVGDDDLRAPRVIERGGRRDERRRDRRLERDLFRIRAEHAREAGADLLEDAEPMIEPGAATELAPRSRVFRERRLAATMQWCQRAVVEIQEPLGDRELGAPGTLLGTLHAHQPAA